MTKLIALENSDLLTTNCTITAINTDERGNYFVTDQTVFYPQSGGQPSDVGIIAVDHDAFIIFTARIVDGDVRHYTAQEIPKYGTNKSAHMQIDTTIRKIHAQYHTGGHLIASLCDQLYPEAFMIKGHHFPGEAYVELQGLVPVEDLEMLNKKITAIITENAPVISKSISVEELGKMFENHPYSPSTNVKLGTKIYISQINNLPPIPCGGTHVHNTKELGKVEITRIKHKKGNTKISYLIL